MGTHFALYGDMARSRVLDRSDVSLDGSVEGAVFEQEVGILTKRAVLEDQAIDIAEQLFARQVTTHQTNVLAIPCQVLTIDFRVVDGHIFRLPESILRIDDGVVDLDIAGILEGIVPILTIVVDTNVRTMHEGIVGLGDGHVTQSDVRAIPERLEGIGELRPLYLDALHAAEHLRCIHLTIHQMPAPAVPQAAACRFGEIAVANLETISLPEDILPLETAILRLDVARLLDRRLTHMDGHLLQSQVVRGVEWAFASKFPVPYYLHIERLKFEGAKIKQKTEKCKSCLQLLLPNSLNLLIFPEQTSDTRKFHADYRC